MLACIHALAVFVYRFLDFFEAEHASSSNGLNVNVVGAFGGCLCLGSAQQCSLKGAYSVRHHQSEAWFRCLTATNSSINEVSGSL